MGKDYGTTPGNTDLGGRAHFSRKRAALSGTDGKLIAGRRVWQAPALRPGEMASVGAYRADAGRCADRGGSWKITPGPLDLA